MQYIIPAAGLGSRFSALGYKDSKPMIPLQGFPLLVWVIANFNYDSNDEIFIVIRENTVDQNIINSYTKNLNVPINYIKLKDLTDGAARTVYLASENLDPNKPMIVANSDQFVASDLNIFQTEVLKAGVDGVILTMEGSGNKWSYVKKTPNENVEIVVEKKQISNEATVGIYGWSRVSDFQKSFLNMEINKDKVNNEYYLAPTYNYLISEKKVIKTINIGKIGEDVFGLGTPEDLVAFDSMEISKTYASLIKKNLMLKSL